MTNAADKDVPLCVDLDGTVARVDLLHEAMLRHAWTSPVALPRMALWMLSGKAKFKQHMSNAVELDATTLPVRQDLIDYLSAEKSRGRTIHLVTASPQAWADQVVAAHPVFDSAMGSGEANNKGSAKGAALVERFGAGGFDYVGDHPVDMAVWEGARTAHIAGPRGQSLAERLPPEKRGEIFNGGHVPVWRAVLKAARPHQWSKNLLLFVALAASHQLLNPQALLNVLLAFVSFSLAASATYIVNDMHDIEMDRAHPRKRRRPLASGALSVTDGFVVIALFGSISIGIAFFLPPGFAVMLTLYVITTLAYSLRLKRATLVDVLVLAALYTLRIVTGGVAASIPISIWLLAFSMFTFISLAISKRCAELTGSKVGSDGRISGRGYYVSDLEILGGMACASVIGASLVLCIYTTQNYLHGAYRSPELLWLINPFFIFILTRIVILARRGHMDDDPIVFCAKDRVTLACFAICGLIVLAAMYVTLPAGIIAQF